MAAVVAWLGAHLPVVLLVVKSVLDLVFAINPSADAPGGVVDWLYQEVKKLLGS